ncbi:MAG: hypothetical protein MJK04_37805, partial [Psychrosphaera sp.]|nr:hypothetical protein [Psychrosphaera sp.]
MGASVKLKSVDEYLYGYVFIELFHLANKYKIFQYLIDYKGESIEKMAEALTLNNDALERILINLSAADILHHHQGIFCINPDYVHFFDQHDDGYIGHFIHFIRNQGRAALQKLEGRLTNETHSQSPYDTLYDTPNDTTDFTQAMWQLSYSTAKGLAQYLPNPLGKIVDIGGGSGAMACAFVQAGISEQLSVFDLAAVREDFDRQMAAHQLTGRINFIDGD